MSSVWMYEHDGMIHDAANPPIVTWVRWPENLLGEPWAETELVPKKEVEDAKLEIDTLARENEALRDQITALQNGTFALQAIRDRNDAWAKQKDLESEVARLGLLLKKGASPVANDVEAPGAPLNVIRRGDVVAAIVHHAIGANPESSLVAPLTVIAVKPGLVVLERRGAVGDRQFVDPSNVFPYENRG